MRRAFALALLAALAPPPAGGAAARPGDDALRVEPPRAAIGVFYHGVHLVVSGVTDSGAAVAMLVTGPAGDLPLRTQARLGGLFWAPSGRVTFEHVPVLYQLAATAPLETLAPAEALRRLGIGYGSFEPDTAQAVARRFFPDLLRLKESERLFRVQAEGVRSEPAAGRPGGGRARVTAAFDFPARAPAATYRVQLFAFRGDSLVERQEASFVIERGGFNALVTSLARQQGLVYGIVAVVIAVGAGILVGLAAGSIGSGGH